MPLPPLDPAYCYSCQGVTGRALVTALGRQQGVHIFRGDAYCYRIACTHCGVQSRIELLPDYVEGHRGA